jgi:hypothetical protein
VDSQQAAAQALREAGVGEVLTMSGEDDAHARGKITDRFRAQSNLVLVSTDTAAEGLNLHERCHHLIHLELPFNPNRLEQRNGRIDRYGQDKTPIVRYFYLRGTFEERILMRLIAKYERQRARLTFVPNTLGMTADDAGSARLLRGLMDEDARLFQDEEAHFALADADRDDAADPAIRDLLEEIDRSLKSFEQATRLHSWLGDAGLGAEPALAADASAALSSGSRAGAVDLARFVADAVLIDGGNLYGDVAGDLFELGLPPAWLHGLDDLPGYDPEARRLRLTGRLDVTRDARERPVGYLGRSHPIVRRGLDRVRNLSFGGGNAAPQDIRASAVAADVAEPALLYTFLGRVASGAGREFERVLAVRVGRDGEPAFYAEAGDWLPLADPARAVRTAGLWERHFAGWAPAAAERARTTASQGFAVRAEAFAAQFRRSLEAELAAMDRWLAGRADEIAPQGGPTPAAAQPGLFERPATAAGSDGSSRPAWADIADPAERLAAFASDRGQHPARRSEADGVLRLHRQRLQALEARLALGKPEIVPLGVLMLAPEEAHRGA